MNPHGFELSGVVHLVRPAGLEVSDLEQMRVALERVPERSLFHHTAGRLLRHPASEELPPDDISGWVAGVVQDRETAERMLFAAEGARSSGALRDALIQVLNSVPEKMRTAHDAPPGGEFVFLVAESVPIPTNEMVNDGRELIERMSESDASVWFYHLIEEPWMTPGAAPLDEWLRGIGEPDLADYLLESAHTGRPLEDIRRRVLRRWRFSRLRERVTAAAHSTEKERSEAGREAMSRLVRRMNRTGENP
jgi:hypothetical protein